MKVPNPDSLRTQKKSNRGVQTTSPDTNKRCHKRALAYSSVTPPPSMKQRGSIQYR